MRKFKVGDKVKVVKNSYFGYWNPGYNGELIVYGYTMNKKDVDVKGKYGKSTLIQVYHPDDLELVEHPNQKLANEVANILRDAADNWLEIPGSYGGSIYEYSCTAAFATSTSVDYQWSTGKSQRVIRRYLKSIGCDVNSFYAFPNHWSHKKRQETRHAWLYLAAQFAEENPDLVPTYGKKKVSV